MLMHRMCLLRETAYEKIPSAVRGDFYMLGVTANPPFYDGGCPGKPITRFKTDAAGIMPEKLKTRMDMPYSRPISYNTV